MLDQKELLSEFAIPTYEQWREAAVAALKGVPFEKKLITKTYEGIDLQPIYNESDRDKVAYLGESLPGGFPFTRSDCATGYKAKSWTVSATYTYPTPVEMNKALKEDLERGQTGIRISVCQCRPSANDGCCSKDDKTCTCPNLRLNDIKDFEDLFAGIDITKYQIDFTINCPTPTYLELATLFVAYCDKHNIDKSKLKVNFGYDFFRFLVRHGSLNNTAENYLDDLAGLVKLCLECGAGFSAIAIDGCTYHNSGANALQEIAYAVAEGVFYIKAMLEHNFGIDDVAKQIQFNFSSGVKFFTEIAKMRAAHVMWAKIIKAFDGNESSSKMIVRAFTSEVDKTVFDPYVNILRGTTEGLAAVLADANTIAVGTFDEELGLPTDFSRRIARNIQCILKEEAHMLDTIDPAGGSYYVETLTDSFVVEGWKVFQSVEKDGGILKSIEDGKIQEAIGKIVAERNKNISFRRDVVLGTNKYPNLAEKPVENIKQVEASVSDAHWKEAQARRKNVDVSSIYTAKWNERANKMIEAYKNGALLNDILLAKGEKEPMIKCNALKPFRSAELFEGLREASDIYKSKSGKAPQIYFECFGQLKQYKPRADFSTDFFAIAGFEITMGKGFLTADEAIKELGNIKSQIVVLCSADDIYPEVVPAYAKAFKATYPNAKLIVAGLQKDEVAAEFKAAGVDDFIHIKSNVYQTLADLLKFIGVM
jgi:methylmalonyl-CoA mutase